MAKFWFISAPLFSHTDWGGFLKTAQQLQALGHDVLWISAPAIQKAVENAGLPFRAIQQTGWLWPPPPPPDLSTIPPQEAVMLRYRRALDTWLSVDIVAEATTALIDLAHEIGKPDLISTDPFLSAAALAAEALTVPMVVCGWPAQSDLNEANLFPVQRTLGSDSRDRLERLCQQFRLTGANFSQGPAPSIFSPHLHVNYFTRGWYATEETTLLPQNDFVGGAPTLPAGEPPEWLVDIPADARIAVVTLGSIFTGDLGFFSWSAQAAAREGFVPIVIIGWNPITPENKAELIAALPKSARLLNWVPFDHLLPRTNLLIHHGGMGTTHAAVIHGIVQIVVPHAADQRVQARRVAQARVGLNLSAYDVRQGRLLEAVHALANDSHVQQTARVLAADMASLGGAEKAAQLISKCVNFA